MTKTNIPEELRRRPQWVNWRIEIRDGEETKVPVNPHTGGRASTTEPSTWGTFDEAIAKDPERLGYVFSEDDPYTGIDLDKCRDPETGEIVDWATKIIEQFNAYTEISPSGTGLHIIVRGKLPGKGNRKGKVEMYDRRRYFTMTGDVLEVSP